jgi:hypothetical protein
VRFDLTAYINEQVNSFVYGLFSDSEKRALALGVSLGFNKACEVILQDLEAETDPESWGAFALPKVREIITKMQGEGA